MPLFDIKGIYQPLEDRAPKEVHGSENDDNPYPQRIPWNTAIVQGLIIALMASILMNVLVFFQRNGNQNEDRRSTYAQLSREILKPFEVHGHENGIPAEEWDFPPTDAGIIALDDAFVERTGLHRAQRYPWDLKKGIYILHGHHNLHCLKMIRQSILEFRQHEMQTQHHLHIDHCLMALREDILCNADDTPRYTGGHHKHPGSGSGQLRQCRDWAQLDRFAKENSACYQSPKSWSEAQHKGVLEYFKHCPDDSRPWEGVNEDELPLLDDLESAEPDSE